MIWRKYLKLSAPVTPLEKVDRRLLLLRKCGMIELNYSGKLRKTKCEWLLVCCGFLLCLATSSISFRGTAGTDISCTLGAESRCIVANWVKALVHLLVVNSVFPPSETHCRWQSVLTDCIFHPAHFLFKDNTDQPVNECGHSPTSFGWGHCASIHVHTIVQIPFSDYQFGVYGSWEHLDCCTAYYMELFHWSWLGEADQRGGSLWKGQGKSNYCKR